MNPNDRVCFNSGLIIMFMTNLYGGGVAILGVVIYLIMFGIILQ